jgi:hypothetical protein
MGFVSPEPLGEHEGDGVSQQVPIIARVKRKTRRKWPDFFSNSSEIQTMKKF